MKKRIKSLILIIILVAAAISKEPFQYKLKLLNSKLSVSSSNYNRSIDLKNFMDVCGEMRIDSIIAQSSNTIYLLLSGDSRCSEGKGVCGAGVEQIMLFMRVENIKHRITEIQFQYVSSCWKDYYYRIVDADSSISVLDGNRINYCINKNKMEKGFVFPR